LFPYSFQNLVVEKRKSTTLLALVDCHVSVNQLMKQRSNSQLGGAMQQVEEIYPRVRSSSSGRLIQVGNNVFFILKNYGQRFRSIINIYKKIHINKFFLSKFI
jgi:hypothetical protein